MNQPLSIKIKDARETLKMTQQELADKAGISQGYIGMVESGKVNPSLKTLRKISAALNVETAFFLEEGTGVFFDEYKDYYSPEEIAFLSDQESRPWITLAKDFKKEGLNPEQVRNLLKQAINLARSFKNS